jgi:mannose-6-phosphate isomerase-like protein (cupin superfamily)
MNRRITRRDWPEGQRPFRAVQEVLQLSMETFDLKEIDKRRAESGEAYLEFFRIPQMSLGVYKLEAGALDAQAPHTEDEIYYVASGRGMIAVGDEERTVQPGSIIFVAANINHHFHTITEHLTLLVFFAPAESTAQR